MNEVGVNLASLITTSAVLTGAIAFSLQAMLGNLWGGIALQADNTCRIGDWIRVDGVVGQIIGIRWRCLAVATNDGETVMMPNAQLVNSRVTVLARRGDVRIPWRRPVEFFVGYERRAVAGHRRGRGGAGARRDPERRRQPARGLHVPGVRRQLDPLRGPVLADGPVRSTRSPIRRSARTSTRRWRATTWKCRCRIACC